MYNIYGITEVSCWATSHRITDDELCVAVDDNESKILNACQLGAPLSKTEIIVYDDNGDVVRGNGIGRLWIGLFGYMIFANLFYVFNIFNNHRNHDRYRIGAENEMRGHLVFLIK